MRLAVIGATGPTGLLVVEKALKRGHEVLALVRNPAKVKLSDPQLKVSEVDIFSVESLTPHFMGCDGVVSCLGAHAMFSTVTLYSESIKTISEAMMTSDCRRLLVVSSWWSRGSASEPFMIKWLAKPLFLGRVLKDMDRMERYLEENCPGLDYTSVRPPQLTDTVDKDDPVLVEEALSVKEATHQFPRSVLARFLLDCVENHSYTKTCVAVGLK